LTQVFLSTTQAPPPYEKNFSFLLLLMAGLLALAQIERGQRAAWRHPRWVLDPVREQCLHDVLLVTLGGNVSPNVSYFVVKGLALGAVTSYGRNWSRQFDPNSLPNGNRPGNKSRSQDFAVGPAVHYYFMLGDKLAVYAQTSLSWGKSWAINTFRVLDPNGAVSRKPNEATRVGVHLRLVPAWRTSSTGT
jgi:hypothetical protein